MDITSLNRGELIEKLSIIFQLNRRYDNACQNLLAIQEKMIPAEQSRPIATMEGRFGGTKGFAFFLAIFCLFGLELATMIRDVLPNKDSVIVFLIVLVLVGVVIYWLTWVCRKIINFVIAQINMVIEGNAEKRNQEIWQYNQQLENEMTPYLQKMQTLQRQYRSVGLTIPKKYAATATVGEILALLQDGRATSWAGAVNLYEEELSRRRIESQMQMQYEDTMYMQSRMIANQELTNMLTAWNLSNTLMR